ncbi:hypothetical protein C5V10_07930 [Salmonella enterica]|nr:hypothetical protein [Salmonella enterica]EBD7685563.1 hypothetical protein [Salmonella enterica]EBG1336175.1 hypothetical protein [Salmonella enterica]ECD8518628.1 hypothetical protein [Salmonella enterica]ECK6780697.1 hypothetical protein [Salmonella enterica]
MNKILFLVVCSIFIPTRSFAVDFDNTSLEKGYDDFKNGSNTPESAEFSGYVRGIATILAAEKEICVPDNSSLDQALNLVGKNLSDEHQAGSNQPAINVVETLTNNYQCS